MFGLKDKEIELISKCFEKYPEVEKVVIYGSRAMNTYKNGSDIDFVIFGDIDFSLLLKIENELENLMMPYKIDILVFNQIKNKDLIEHIDRVGKVFYQKK